MIAPKVFAPKRPRPRRVTLIRREADRIGAGPVVMGFLFLAVALSYAVLGRTTAPDPYLGKARRLIARYEAGRPEPARDYESDVYVEALKTLALVSGTPQEESAARDLAMEIQGKMAVQRARERMRGRELLATQEARQRRDRAFMEETQRTTVRADDDEDRAARSKRPGQGGVVRPPDEIILPEADDEPGDGQSNEPPATDGSQTPPKAPATAPGSATPSGDAPPAEAPASGSRPPLR